MIAAYQNRPCKVPADRERDGHWFCHLHDPEGKHQKLLANKYPRQNRQHVHPDVPEPVAPLIEDHTLSLFELPTKEQKPIIKRRLTAWRRSAFWSTQPAQPDPQPSKSHSSPPDTSDARYAQ